MATSSMMTPWREYPGTRARTSILLLPGGERPLDSLTDEPAQPDLLGRLDDELRSHRAVPMDLRTPVAAIGSNAAPEVVRTKLLAAGLTPIVPMVCGRLHNLRISLSAHVSLPGFVPAAPAWVAGDVAQVVVGWFDAEQLARIDITEPNYDRIWLPARDHRLDLPGWPDLGGVDGAGAGVDVYRSKRGVLAGPDGPWHLRPQPELSATFAKLGIEPWVTKSPLDAARALAGSGELRAQARREFRRLNLVRLAWG
ncbi:MAG TPA: hypothetical protein VLL08_15115 [Kineosporiaceae bacterium]|nr:hypothetical protein [Kineosporiaceae bacterium]